RIGQPAPRPEHLQEFFGLRLDPPKQARLLQDHRPGKYGKNRKNTEDNASHPARLFNQSPEPAGYKEERQARNNIPQNKYRSWTKNTVAHAPTAVKRINPAR